MNQTSLRSLATGAAIVITLGLAAVVAAAGTRRDATSRDKGAGPGSAARPAVEAPAAQPVAAGWLPGGTLMSDFSAAGFGVTPGTTRGDVTRGRYLVTAIGCGDCHTPKVMGPNGPVEDEQRLLSGHPEGSALPPAPPLPAGPWIATLSADLTAWSGPWGTSYAFNLTPDENTGIGSWSEDTFVRAIRTGRHMGVSRPILPPMPWPAFRNLSDEDLRSIYAYLRSIPAIHNRVPEPLPPAPAPQQVASH
jgi:mono/diheme cytochrome c family protein